jgi:hypothetical protein
MRTQDKRAIIRQRRSPLKDQPLRAPGQSLQEEIDRLQGDEVDTYAALAAAALCLAAFEWVAWLFHWPRNPIGLSVLAVATIAYSIIRVRKAKRRIRLLRLGRDGERVVADALDKLKQEGILVLHDIVGDGFNIDHILLARQGIYAIETKTYTKWQGAEITYDGKAVRIGSFEPPRDPIRQVNLIAKWLKSTLKEMTGKNYNVRPVVVFPGWYVRNQGPADKPEVWVLNPGQLPAIVADQPACLSEEDVKAAVYFLTRLVKTRSDAD